MKGTISSTSTITNVNVRVKNNSTKEYEINKSLSNSSSTFDLGRLDNYITFNTLTAGSKTIEVYATSGGVFKVLARNNFTVGSTSSPNTGLMVWPVPSSSRLSSCYLDGRSHCALDICASSGAQVVSSCSGKVVALNNTCTHNYAKSSSCGCGGGFGNYVVVESNEGGYSGNTYCVDPTYYVQVPTDINANAATTQCCYDYVTDLKKRLGYN